MKTAAVYCRVSTDAQEIEGTSLQTQLEACLRHCHDKGYEVAYRFSESCTGLSLERPELDKLRDLVRAEVVNVVVIYAYDRLTRDPAHGVILTEELDKHGVKLEGVTEDLDNSDLGKLIAYIKGYASKLEAQKIRERTMRGRRARAAAGRISAGSGMRMYGYDYVPVSQENGGRRAINDTEARWVRQMYGWLVNDGLSTNAITLRLRDFGVLSKTGKVMSRSSVQSILTNPAYTGRMVYSGIEIPGATPAILSRELFDAAQKQLKVNAVRSSRHVKHQYLLRGHIRCRRCGRTYDGSVVNNGGRRYRCLGRRTLWTGAPERCHNKGWSADLLESLVWSELERYLGDRNLIIGQLEAHRNDASQVGILDGQLADIELHLKTVDREQRQLLQWALKGFPEDQVETENNRLNKARETLVAQKTETEAQLRVSREAVLSVPKLEAVVEHLRKGIANLDFEGRRQVLDALSVTVWLDGSSIGVTGTIDVENDSIVHTLSWVRSPLSWLGEGQG